MVWLFKIYNNKRILNSLSFHRNVLSVYVFIIISGPNVALNKSASQSPGTYKDYTPPNKVYPANLAVDGNEDSDFSKGSCSHTSASHYNRNDHVAQWTVDLGGEFYVSGIIIVNRKGNFILGSYQT